MQNIRAIKLAFAETGGLYAILFSENPFAGFLSIRLHVFVGFALKPAGDTQHYCSQCIHYWNHLIPARVCQRYLQCEGMELSRT